MAMSDLRRLASSAMAIFKYPGGLKRSPKRTAKRERGDRGHHGLKRREETARFESGIESARVGGMLVDSVVQHYSARAGRADALHSESQKPNGAKEE